MSNFAKVIKEEISRVARKEQRGESAGLKKAAAAHRSDIAALKRRIGALEQAVKKLSKHVVLQQPKKSPQPPNGEKRLRFSAARLRAQRERQGLSATMLAKIIGVSPQSVHNWETGKVRPNPTQLRSLAASRVMSPKEIEERLEA